MIIRIILHQSKIEAKLQGTRQSTLISIIKLALERDKLHHSLMDSSIV